MARRVSQGGASRRLLGWWSTATVQDRRNLALLGTLAVAIRLVLIVAYSPVLGSDSHTYLDAGHQLVSGNFSAYTGGRTPGYPLLLVVLDYSPVATWCLQALLGVIATFLVYGLVRRLGGGPYIALAAALLYALDFEVLAIEHTIQTETLASFLLLIAAHLAVTIVEARRASRAPAAALGLVLAYLCLVRPDDLAITLYLAVALTVAVRLARSGSAARGLRGAVGPALWILVPPLVVLAAWTGFNRAAIGVTSVDTVLGYNMIDHVAAYVRAQPGPDYPIEAAYVAARARRERRTSDLGNLSADAGAAMRRASHLDAAHLSGRLLSIALSVIVHHPAQYLASSLKQWPRFWIPPNYAYEFAHGLGSGVIRAVWKLERAVLLLINAGFILLGLTELVRRARRREGLLSRPSLVLAGVGIVGIFPATFLAYGETGRYGYPYFPLVLGVTFATAEPLLRALRVRAPGLRGRPRPSRV